MVYNKRTIIIYYYYIPLHNKNELEIPQSIDISFGRYCRDPWIRIIDLVFLANPRENGFYTVEELNPLCG